jgi:Ulp1 family protease
MKWVDLSFEGEKK